LKHCPKLVNKLRVPVTFPTAGRRAESLLFKLLQQALQATPERKHSKALLSLRLAGGTSRGVLRARPRNALADRESRLLALFRVSRKRLGREFAFCLGKRNSRNWQQVPRCFAAAYRQLTANGFYRTCDCRLLISAC
jgi:hypothetical protein